MMPLPADPGTLGSLLTGLGTFIGSVVAALGLAWAVMNSKRIAGYLHVYEDNKRLTQKNVSLEERAIAAEQRANNWEKGAEGAQFTMDQVLSRLESVEARATKAEELIPRFNALLGFTKSLIKHSVAIEKQLAAAGFTFSGERPRVPDILTENLGWE